MFHVRLLDRGFQSDFAHQDLGQAGRIFHSKQVVYDGPPQVGVHQEGLHSQLGQSYRQIRHGRGFPLLGDGTRHR